MERLQRSALWCVAVVAWCGVLLQLWLSVRLALGTGGTVADGLLAYSGYFTVLTNLFVALVASAASTQRGARTWWSRPMVVGCATTGICMVGLAYHLLLRHVWNPQGWQWLADMLLHYATPIAMLAWWCLFAPRVRLPLWAPLAWCLYVAGYLAYALARGEILGTYPCYFIDAGRLGYGQVLANSFGLLGMFVAIGALVLLVSRWRARVLAVA